VLYAGGLIGRARTPVTAEDGRPAAH